MDIRRNTAPSKSSNEWQAARVDARLKKLRPVKAYLQPYLNAMPKHIRKQVFTEQKVQRIYRQFATLVSPFILQHTNAVYLLPDEKDGFYKLVVYVNNSTCAAELNARRELMRLQYREHFQIVITEFEIRISKGRWVNRHPFQGYVQDSADNKPADTVAAALTESQEQEIQKLIEPLEPGPLKESFKRAIKSQKIRQNLKP